VVLTNMVSVGRRKEPIVAIGGGVCLDVVGLASNLYRRNTPVIKASSRRVLAGLAYLSPVLSVYDLCREWLPRKDKVPVWQNC